MAVLPNTVYDYAGKADRSKGYWNLKRKVGVTRYFSMIIKQKQENCKSLSDILQCKAFSFQI